MKKIILIVLIFFAGCANKEYIFIPTNAKCTQKTDIKIGINKVKLPYYMNDLEIMQLKNTQLIPTNRYLSKNPTEIIVTKLSNRLCDPNVFIYPWGEKPKYKVDIKIDDFYFQDNSIYLNARIYINNKFFKINISKKCNNEYNCINKGFDIIINKIIKGIKWKNIF